MKKIYMTILAVIALPCLLWAQTITAKSTAEECLDFISKSLSWGENLKLTKSNFSNNGIKNTYKIGEADISMAFIYLDWASYHDLQVSESDENSLITVLLTFNSDFLFHNETSKGDQINRNALRTNILDFYLTPAEGAKIPDIKKAAERLAELAKLKGSPLLNLNAPKGWAEVIPTSTEYEESSKWFKVELGGWEMSIKNDENSEAWLTLQKNDLQFYTTKLAKIPKNKLKTVHSDGKALIFTGETFYQSTEEPEIKKLTSFRLPLLGSELIDDYDTSDVLHMTKYYLWKNGVDLSSGGYDIEKYLPKNL